MANPLEIPGGVEPATPALAAGLARRLDPDHAREILDVSGLAPGPALALSLAASLEAYAYVPPGREEALFMMGVEARSPLTRGARLWLLGSKEKDKRPAGLLRAARWGLARAFRVSGADCLEQFIPDWYRTGLRFALRLGCSLTPSGLRARSGSPLWHVVFHRR